MYPFYYDSNAACLVINNDRELQALFDVYGEDNVTAACLVSWQFDGLPVYSLYFQDGTNSLKELIDNQKKTIFIPRGVEIFISDGRNSQVIVTKYDMRKEVISSNDFDYYFRINERHYRVDKSLVTVISTETK